MQENATSSPACSAGYYFTDAPEGRYRGWLLVFPLESLWESPLPMGNALEKMRSITLMQWERRMAVESRREVGADSYAAYWETLSCTRAKTSVLLSRPSRRLPFSAKPRRYACGNLLLLRDGWQPGSPFELYAFSSDGIAVSDKGYRHQLCPASLQLVLAGTLPTDAK